MPIESADLLGVEMTHDATAHWAALRAHDPVHWNEQHKAWVVTRYEDVVAGFTDPRLSSDRIRPLLDVVSAERRAELAPMLGVMSDWMVVSDPPAHTRLRSLANAAFRQQRIVTMNAWIAEIVEELLDDFIASGETDFVAGVAYPMPATVIAKMLGAPASDRGLFQIWSDELALVAFSAGGDARRDRHSRALAGVAEMQQYLGDLIAQVEKSPGDDMISALLEPSRLGGEDRLSREELISLCSLILFAGHETTTNLLCNAVVALSRHPDQLELLAAEPSLTNAAVEEVLRLEGPIKIIVRWVAADLELGGRSIKAGARVYLVLQSANRDEDFFADGDRFDIRRASPTPHVAFGRGAHACLGAQLARIEARVALPRIIARLPGLTVPGPVTWKSNIASRAVERLDVDHLGRAVPDPQAAAASTEGS
ncbi:cytochrome P450 [Aeromicrobium sp. SMF47]|uniref:cytochrome P450 n=1 Tax=Aeromicrobium yanjiei TaxID=2662028 RepID=UPI00129EBB86|nr:cytochrome P450 [Aeromicrobium yanjiei]MRJ75142.1 cytochrome P450 [Aeromicrobium yanjiei]